ncbi:membrane protein [Virgisporangium aliadipatigenens]|uniref:Membrane protein n=1 Tax=Virgisporangium aliadipatigenens TaxID=741659 RepID=A0A8J3YS50_9ACTN|nr:DUF4126 domain-containing protein [Virgisporangium aliadipatigenens]GIJ48831.1 membrane protein [Virgisporangium aliadipatigenens]
MFEVLTGTGLAASAGLNAYIPLLTVGLLAKYTELISLPQSWQWLENPFILLILGGLLAIEFVADKVPAVDHVNDVLQTVVRPTAGGLAFGAAASAETTTVSDPAQFFSSNQWVPVVVGIVISLCVHAMKAAFRAGANAVTVGFAAPVVSVVEDVVAVSLSLVAIILPIVVVVFVVGLILVFWWAMRRRRARREARLAARPGY